MKTTQPGDTKPVPPLSRRKFLEQGAGAALALSVVPRHVLGGPGYVPPSDKVNIAFIGVGSQGLRVMLHFLKEPDVQGVAVCDPNKASADYPQWDTHEFSKSVRALLGVDSGWEDRKSTRLNSSHVSISYAVFCLKKKNSSHSG